MMETTTEGRTERHDGLVWMAGLALGGALMLAGCGDTHVDPRLVSSSATNLVGARGEVSARGDPPCTQHAGAQDEDSLRSELHRAHRVAALNRAALEQLRKDRRTAEPARYDGYDSAVADTMAMIDEADSDADCLESALDAQADQP